MSISREREDEIRKMTSPPSDPVEKAYWHYHQRMVNIINIDAGTNQTWDEMEEEVNEYLRSILKKHKDKKAQK